jgi:hypothetical protein
MPQQPQNQMQMQMQQNIWSNGNNPPPQQNLVVNFTAQIENINGQQMKLRDQIILSEKNLQAQHQVNKSFGNDTLIEFFRKTKKNFFYFAIWIQLKSLIYLFPSSNSKKLIFVYPYLLKYST